MYQKCSAAEIKNIYKCAHLVVFIGGVVLEEDDALAVKTPIVPFSLIEWRNKGT